MSECISCKAAIDEYLRNSKTKAIERGKNMAIEAKVPAYYIYIHTHQPSGRQFYRAEAGTDTKDRQGVEYYTVL